MREFPCQIPYAIAKEGGEGKDTYLWSMSLQSVTFLWPTELYANCKNLKAAAKNAACNNVAAFIIQKCATSNRHNNNNE